MIAPATTDALADVTRALGFELRPSPLAAPIGVDEDVAGEQPQYAIFRGGEVVFDGTARECSAFLIGWRDLRRQVLGAVHASDAKVVPEMSGIARCRAADPSDRMGEHCCLLPVGHEGAHSALRRWRDQEIR